MKGLVSLRLADLALLVSRREIVQVLLGCTTPAVDASIA
jgi:hypothetical protein